MATNLKKSPNLDDAAKNQSSICFVASTDPVLGVPATGSVPQKPGKPGRTAVFTGDANAISTFFPLFKQHGNAIEYDVMKGIAM